MGSRPAGGVGTLLLKAGRAVGLAGGPGKVERARATGADAAVDYDDGWDARVRDALGDRRATTVLDGVGGRRWPGPRTAGSSRSCSPSRSTGRPDAHRALEERATVGKVVLVP